MPLICSRHVMLRILVALGLLMVVPNCGDGVGQPIVSSPTISGVAGLGGLGAQTRDGRHSGSPIDEKDTVLTTGLGGYASVEPSSEPDVRGLDCSSIQQWPTEWARTEDDLLVLINVLRDAGLSCEGNHRVR